MGGAPCGVPLALCVLLMVWPAGSQNPKPCARWCPENSECVTLTSCRCKPGFSPFDEITSPLDTCDDINECVESSGYLCGPFADCNNVEGSFYCTCTPGYELISGERNFTNVSENTCKEISRVTAAPSWAHTSSASSGTFSDPLTTTDPGEISWVTTAPSWAHTSSASSGTFSAPLTTTDPGTQAGDAGGRQLEDVNECSSGQNPCHASTHCLNKVSGYECRCRPGWKPIPGSPNGPNNTQCEDMDECTSGQHECHNSTVCANTRGSYKCRCRPGWELVPGSPKGSKNTVCREIPSPTWTPPPGIHSQSLSSFFDEVQDLIRDVEPVTVNRTIQKVVETLDKLLEDPGDLETLALPDQHQGATQLLLGLEQTLRTLAKSLPEGPFTYLSPSNTELSLVIKDQKDTNVTTVGHSSAWMSLNWTVVTGAQTPSKGRTVAGILSSPHMKKLLANASLELDQRQAELEDIYESPVHGAQLRLLSSVNSVFLTNMDTKRLTSNVTFNFSHLWETPGPRDELICAFWKGDGDRGGQWSTAGCRLLDSWNGSSSCQCDHLSSFAILMAHYDVQDPRLALITKVGLSLSIVCLLLCILTFLLVRPIQSSRTTVHLHLCICLFVGSVVFLAGIENEGGGEVGLRCRLVAALLHYCFLAAFCWMGLEGLELYFLVVRVFQGQGLRTRWLCLIGYGVPLLIVAASAAVNAQGYGRPTYCWLDHAHGFLWSFLGPLAAVILCNAVIFVVTVWKLAQKFSEVSPDSRKLRRARVLTVTAIAQLFVLGCTWVFGLFLFDPHSRVLSYAFTLLNCLQGCFLYVLHCLLNKKVREEYRKWACSVAGGKYSEFSSSLGATSHNQTQIRAFRTSDSGM